MKVMACLVERRARTSKGGTRLKERAFSRNFHVMGMWLSKQIWETNRWASSIEGKSTPAELRLELSWIAHSCGSQFLTWADLVSSSTESQTVQLAAAISQLNSFLEIGFGFPVCSRCFGLCCWKRRGKKKVKDQGRLDSDSYSRRRAWYKKNIFLFDF